MIIGLTGGIASGKTTVTNIFSNLGFDIIDADIIARDIVKPNQYCFKEIVKYFGKTILINEELDRKKLRKIIFADQIKKNWLNNLMHPIIEQELKKKLENSNSTNKILVAPLLIENKLEYLVDKIIVIDVEENIQLQRVLKRDNVDKNQALKIINSQVSRDIRLKKADFIITNNFDLNHLQKQIKKLHTEFIK